MDLARAWVGDGLEHVAQKDQQLPALALLIHGRQVEYAERGLVVFRRLLEREIGPCLVAGAAAEQEGPLHLTQSSCLSEVSRELCRACAGALIENVRHSLVKTQPAAGRQLVVQRRTHERMGEAVSALHRRDALHETRPLSGLERVEHLRRVARAQREHGLHVELAADHRRATEDLVGGSRQP